MHPLTLVAFAAAAAPQLSQEQSVREEIVYYDRAAAQGRLSGGRVRMTVDHRGRFAPTPPAEVTTLRQSETENRIDLVFVGDGYTAPELEGYAQDVDALVAGYFLEEPYVTYAPYFNVHRVDVVSNESGVDHDPYFGI